MSNQIYCENYTDLTAIKQLRIPFSKVAFLQYFYICNISFDWKDLLYQFDFIIFLDHGESCQLVSFYLLTQNKDIS